MAARPVGASRMTVSTLVSIGLPTDRVPLRRPPASGDRPPETLNTTDAGICERSRPTTSSS